MKRMTLSIVVLAMLASGVCGAERKSLKVSSKDYGDDWPFTVASVDLLCFGPSPKALARTSDGTVYALSGSARSHAKDHGWSDGEDITKPNPTMPSIKMDYSDIVQRAQALCGDA
ncbi:hypothetical protein A7J50_1723 [Pseudomonas antarctica]|uniref:DUF2511 domain-containing protein n=1 Tax=Pseudomonas antarctica TaxID=219572 RepID=A0A172YYV4_9PSED|nr:DUF2511 domain-containing protein [Pseudomonas antarctica]ANF85146.1 hypothetical protein A7J50_1723 [Pseudomonas antarctica]